MSYTRAPPPLPELRDDYGLQEVDAAWLTQAVKLSRSSLPLTGISVSFASRLVMGEALS